MIDSLLDADLKHDESLADQETAVTELQKTAQQHSLALKAQRTVIDDHTSRLDNLEASGGGSESGSGLTKAQITALDDLFRITAYTEDASAPYAAFRTAFGLDSGGEEPDTPDAELESISATYSGGDVSVGTDINELTGIVVTAHYSDGSTATVTDYTLSGIIAEGNNTVTVTYGGMTTTFIVTGVIIPDIPSDVVIPDGYELVEILEAEDIVYGYANYGKTDSARASYPYFTIPVHRGYTYRVDVEFDTEDAMQWGVIIHPPTGANGDISKLVYDGGWLTVGTLTWEDDIVETNEKVTDITKVAWLTPGFKKSDNTTFAEGVKRVVVYRKLLDGAVTGGDEWETVRTLTDDEIVYGTTNYGTANDKRAAYPYLDIPVEAGYVYYMETETNVDDEIYHAFSIASPEGANGNPSNFVCDQGWGDAAMPYIVSVTEDNSAMTDISKVAWGVVAYKRVDEAVIEQGTIKRTTIKRRKV